MSQGIDASCRAEQSIDTCDEPCEHEHVEQAGLVHAAVRDAKRAHAASRINRRRIVSCENADDFAHFLIHSL